MSFSMVSFGDIITAAGLAMKIVQVLYYSPRASEDYQDAMAELVSLHHELILINDAIHLDTSSGPGELVRHNVAMEVGRCRYAAVPRQKPGRRRDRDGGNIEQSLVGRLRAEGAASAEGLGGTPQGGPQRSDGLI
jgi:hypothetical protein